MSVLYASVENMDFFFCHNLFWRKNDVGSSLKWATPTPTPKKKKKTNKKTENTGVYIYFEKEK